MTDSPSPKLSPSDDSRALLRRGVYGLLIALAVGSMLGRILAVTNPNPQIALPTLSANDRSRWDTVRSLVEKGTYAIDDIIKEPNWDTIDKVQHRGRDGQEHFYSSKPPLFTTLVAGEYWLIYHLTGATLAEHPYAICRFMLVTINVVPLLVYFLLLARLLERYGRTDWGRMLLMAAAALGTFLTTFAVTLNNHVPGAVCALAALYCGLRIWHDGSRAWGYFAAAGFFAAFTVTDELPALAFLAALFAGLLWIAPRLTLAAFLPAVLLVAAGFFGTNWIALNSLAPAYAHKNEKAPSDVWYRWNNPVKNAGDKPVGGYWTNPNGIDKGEPSAAIYAIQATIGHHGILSLTPIWLLAIPGVFLLGWGRNYGLRGPALLIGGVTIVCLTFYLFLLPPAERNYGGMTSGFRWVFWMAPLWLLACIPAADWLAATRVGRSVGYILLALSVLSASYPTVTPWTYPWLTRFFIDMGWTKF